ncbi:hypothetical protein DFP72DRAFT_904272, partial [Ephemerocybe angulata]
LSPEPNWTLPERRTSRDRTLARFPGPVGPRPPKYTHTQSRVTTPRLQGKESHWNSKGSERFLEEAIAQRDETIGLLVRSLKRREDELDAKSREFSALCLRLEEAAEERGRNEMALKQKDAEIEAMSREISTFLQRLEGTFTGGVKDVPVNASKSDPVVRIKDRHSLQSSQEFGIGRNQSIFNKSEEYTTHENYDEIVASLRHSNAVLIEKLSECHSQLVTSRSAGHAPLRLPYLFSDSSSTLLGNPRDDSESDINSDLGTYGAHACHTWPSYVDRS